VESLNRRLHAASTQSVRRSIAVQLAHAEAKLEAALRRDFPDEFAASVAAPPPPFVPIMQPPPPPGMPPPHQAVSGSARPPHLSMQQLDGDEAPSGVTPPQPSRSQPIRSLAVSGPHSSSPTHTAAARALHSDEPVRLAHPELPFPFVISEKLLYETEQMV
jgi:hypothetical protein